MKRILLLVLLCLCFAATAVCESLPMDGPAPYDPVQSAYSDDLMNYDDGTLSIHITTEVRFDTNIYYVRVKLTDASQFRTALAAKYPSKTRRFVPAMAEEANAVLALNGDFFSYQSSGIVVRNGVCLRENPASTRDTLLVDANGDFHVLTRNTRAEWEQYRDLAVHTFSFGPALIADGQKIEFNYRDKISCGAPTPAQRLGIAQVGPLEYLFIATEGPEMKGQKGISLFQLIELFEENNAIVAYNLDGGSSTFICMNGQRINAPEIAPRAVGDIIYFATLVH